MPEIEISQTTLAWISFALAFTFAFIIKDVLTNVAQGIMFRFSSQFKEGDHVIIDEEDAIIVNIGLRYTKFGIFKENGSYAWLYLPNDKIKNQKIERVIHTKEEMLKIRNDKFRRKDDHLARARQTDRSSVSKQNNKNDSDDDDIYN